MIHTPKMLSRSYDCTSNEHQRVSAAITIDRCSADFVTSLAIHRIYHRDILISNFVFSLAFVSRVTFDRHSRRATNFTVEYRERSIFGARDK